MLQRACLAGCLSSSPNGMGFIALPALSLKITQLKLVRKIYAFQQAPCFQPAQQPSPDTAQKYLCNRNRRSAPRSQRPSQTQPGVLAPLCALNARNCLLRDLSLLLFCFLWHLAVLHQLAVPGLSGVPPLRRCPRTVEAQQLSHASGCATSCQGCGTAQELPGG